VLIDIVLNFDIEFLFLDFEPVTLKNIRHFYSFLRIFLQNSTNKYLNFFRKTGVKRNGS